MRLMRLIHSSKTKQTLVWFTIYSLVSLLLGPLALAREGESLFGDHWQQLFIQGERRGPRPKPGVPEGEFPNLNEIRQRNHPDPQAPEHVPSIIRSKRNPLVPWDGRRVGEEQIGTSLSNHPRDLKRRVTTSIQRNPKIRIAHHARPGLIPARSAVPPVPDDQYVQNFFYWALLRYPNGTETTYWNDIFRAAYANAQGSLVLATRELGKTLFESSEYAARNRNNHWYVFDLYKTFLMRDPDSGWAFWENAVATSGRENVRRAFEDCIELSNLLATITPNGSISTAVSSLLTARSDPSNQPGNGMLARDATWSVPLLSLPGRSGLDLGLALSYSSMVWTRSGPYIYFDEDNGFPSPGFRLGFPTVQRRLFDAQVTKNAYLLITSTRTRVELRRVGTSNIYEATDSSYLQLTDNGSSLLVRSTDGTQLNYVEFNNEYRCTQIKDRNGNYMTVNYNGLGQITTITDTLARVTTFNYDSNANLLSISQSWNGQTHNWATFGWGTRTMQSSFSGLSVVGAPNGTVIPIITQVGLHDGSYFTFDYTNSLQTSIVRRYTSDQVQRSATTFDYNGAVSECPRLIATRVSAHNWTGLNGVPTEVVTQYGVEGAACVMTAPDGTIYKEFYGTGWQKGLTTLSEVWSGGIRQKWTTTAWARDNTSSANDPLNPRPTETNVYDAAGNRRRTTIEYHPSFGLPSVVTEYAADAATVLRRTCFDYKNESVYIDRRIIGLLFRHMVYDGNWNLMVKSEYGYDWDWSGDMFQDTPAPATQHDRTNYGPAFITGRGNLSQVARFDVNDPNNASNTWQETKWRVNSTGSVLMERDHQWHQSFISYGDSFSDGNNSRNTFAYPTTITDAGGFSSYVQYNFDFGAKTRVQGPPPLNQSQGIIKTFSYDNAIRLSQTTTVNNGAYTRHMYGPNYIQSYGTVNNVADEAYSVQMFDGAGRVTAAANNHPNSTGGYSAVHSVYDAMGRLIKRSNSTEVLWDWSPFGDDAAGWFYTQQTYDWQGRPRITTNTDGTTKEASYGGCGCAGGAVVTLTDEGTIDGGIAKGRQQKIYSDVLGRMVKTEVLNWQGGSVYSATVHTYNARDQVTLVRQFQGNAPSNLNDLSCPAGTCQQTVMTYDGRGRLKTKHVPEQNAGTATTWDYNSDDTVKKITDARGASQTFSYNSRHLITGITYNAPAGITIPAAVSFGYDAAGNRTSMVDGLGSMSYQYDQLSTLRTETRTFSDPSNPAIHNVTKSLTYDYNRAGILTSIIDATGAAINYEIDSAGRIKTVTGSPYGGVTTYAWNFKYRAWGALKHLNYGNGKTLDAAYNARLQTTTFTIPTVTAKTYDYYADGSLRFSSDAQDHRFDRSYSFDHVARIKEAFSGAEARGEPATTDRPYKQTFSYDALGHLTGRNSNHWTEVYSISDSYQNNRRTGWNYDADGNLLNSEEAAYTYDAAGQIRTVQTESTLASGLDGDGRQVKSAQTWFNEQTQSSATINIYYLRSSVLGGEIVTEMAYNGSKGRTFIYAGGARLAWQEGGDPARVIWEHRDPGNASFRTSDATGYTGGWNQDSFPAELDPTGADNGTSNPYIEPLPPSDEGNNSLLPYPSFSDPRNPGITYSFDGIAVPVDYFFQLVDTVFHGRLGVVRAVAASSTRRIGLRNRGVSWGRPFEVIYDANGRIVSYHLGDFDPNLRGVNYGIETSIYNAWSFNFEWFFNQPNPQETKPEELIKSGTAEAQARLKNGPCGKFFGGTDKGLKALNSLNFSVDPSMDKSGHPQAQISGNNVSVNPYRGSPGGGGLLTPDGVGHSYILVDPKNTANITVITLFGAAARAFGQLHETGHKAKRFGNTDTDWPEQNIMNAFRNNFKIWKACFSETTPQIWRGQPPILRVGQN